MKEKAIFAQSVRGVWQDSPIPYRSLFAVTLACLIPWWLELAGIDFGTAGTPATTLAAIQSEQLFDQVHYVLAGSFVHTILEWSAFCTALFTAILAFVHFTFNRETVTPIVGVGLFYAGCMDAFHTLAADRLIEGVANNESLIPFTWAICRLFSAVIMIAGAGFFLIFPKQHLYRRFWSVAIASILSGIVAYLSILLCVKSENLPQTMFADALITRPWDVAPLLLFIGAGLFIFPGLCCRYPSLFSKALLVSVIPQIVTQLHMAFGSTALFDSDFNIAHFLKIVAYFIPFIGLCLSYIQINQEKTKTLSQLEDAKSSLLQRSDDLAQANAALKTSECQLREQKNNLEEALEQLKATQFQLVQTEKMSSLGQLVAGVAHEINNPVNFIAGNLTHAEGYSQELLNLISLYQQHHPQPHPEVQSRAAAIDLDFIRRDFPYLHSSMKMGTQRIKEIVLSLRNFSRMDEAEFKAVDLHEGLDSTLVVLEHRLKLSNIELVKDYGMLPLVLCYAGQLNQVFMNVLSNAIDALEMLQSPAIPTWTPKIRIRTEACSSMIRIVIADNGGGIPAHMQSRIFDPFFTTKKIGQGTGLGLSISYQIVVDQHQGTLDCFSQEGEGSEFAIQIPANLQCNLAAAGHRERSASIEVAT